MLRPAGRVAANVRVSPAAGAAKWLEASSENAWPSLALWLAIAVPVGPVPATASVKLSLIDLPWATVAGTVIGLLSSWSLKVRAPETAPVGISVVWPSGGLACEVGALAADGANNWPSNERAWPSSALRSEIAIGPMSPTGGVTLPAKDLPAGMSINGSSTFTAGRALSGPGR